MAITLTFNPLTGNFDAVLVATANVQAWMAAPSSANLATAMTTKTGTAGNLVFSTAPTLTGPVAITEVVGSSGLTITGATQTASFPALSITQTWNNAGVTFTGWKLNITNTASATASLLADLQIGGSSQFSVRRDGLVTTSGGVTIASGSSLLWSARGGISPSADGLFQFFTNGFATNVNLAVDASNVLAQRNSTNAQTFRVYNTYTDASNYERLSIDFSTVANRGGIGVQAAGTGTVRNFSLFYGNSNSSAVLISGSALSLGVIASNSVGVNIGGSISITGTSGTWAGQQTTYLYAPTSTSTMVAVPVYISPTINYSNATPGAGSYEALKIAVTETALPTGTNYLIRASAGVAGTTEKFSVRNTGLTTWADAADLVFGTSTGTKIGTATSQKLGLWNATPVVQPTTGVTAAAFVANTSGTLDDSATYGGYTLGQVVAALKSIGALA